MWGGGCSANEGQAQVDKHDERWPAKPVDDMDDDNGYYWREAVRGRCVRGYARA